MPLICCTATCLCTLLALLVLPLWAPAPTRASAYQAATCQELLINGNFEAGSAGWTQSSAGGYDLISQFNPRTGRWGAYLAGANNADDRLSQPVLLPQDAVTITLRLWWSLESEEPPVPADTLTLSLLQPNGVLLVDLWQVDNTVTLGIWDEIVIDLKAYAGQSVVVRFQALSGSFDLTDFYLDDVSVTVCTPVTTINSTWLPLAMRQR
ncbi:MAG TPA: hypothetical protein VL334_11455 [Anaerolineae bacterium]|nr:hypothetical protein [Anaerolineae bacterium]